MRLVHNYLPFLIPYIILEMLLAIIALIHIFTHRDYRFGNRWLWVVLVLCFQIIGPVAYLTIGRSDE